MARKKNDPVEVVADEAPLVAASAIPTTVAEEERLAQVKRLYALAGDPSKADEFEAARLALEGVGG